MHKIKKCFELPESESIELTFEGSILTLSETEVNATRGAYGYYDLDEDDD